MDSFNEKPRTKSLRKLILKRVSYFLQLAFYSFSYLYLTLVIFFNFARGNLTAAIILNIVFIILFVIEGKIEVYLSKKVRPKNKEPTILSRIVGAYLDGPSVKAALYVS